MGFGGNTPYRLVNRGPAFVTRERDLISNSYTSTVIYLGPVVYI